MIVKKVYDNVDLLKYRDYCKDRESKGLSCISIKDFISLQKSIFDY